MKFRAGLVVLCAFAGAALQAQTLAGPALVKALHRGGYVIVMRHASAPPAKPGKEDTNLDNVFGERQLDPAGQQAAAEFGKAVHRLKIPFGDVLTSPTYRALETARLANLRDPRPEAELGDNGESMKPITEAQAAWLRKQVTQFTAGTNTLLITHLPNFSKAFPDLMPPPTDGEAVVFGPDGKGGATVVARIKIDEWPHLKG